ncbi:polysaccharide pyruvyl transferase family protein [Shewanella abyssi]|uniref:polysaccharide pyruvyl transferase family protein n=1 Tax=Shewanella abyssi TaxID=311789 RepID=UPI00200E3040|nr:polysaccharide pyruvyl transferase family protein [Shewanella abyssi]MCL1049585.1 polysaccharide pyruvyl transferase family protein [Shewanella abyssi]
MMIEIKGIGLPNRGAELMLLAVIQEFEKRGVESDFVVEPLGDYKTRVKYNLFQKSRFFGKGYNFGWPFSLLPKVIRDKYGIVNKNEIDLVIDASGFAYGDKWGKKLIQDRLGKEIDYFNTKGVKVILLPQAFGSFNDKAVANATANIICKSDLVIARDQTSYDFVKQLGTFSQLQSFPDFTNLVKPVICTKYDSLKDRACIIPNFQMMRRGNVGGEYKTVLANSLKYLIENGHNPYLLIHEGPRDLALANEINDLLPIPVEIIDPQDALDIKSIISRSSIVIGSRFHGLVSALSTGIPVIAMGWSHKYEMLLNDYDVSELLVEVKEEFIIELVEKLTNDQDYRASTLAKINMSSAKQKKLTEKMWDSVFSAIQ